MSYGGQQNRTEWYDRAPLVITKVYATTNVAPHGLTSRWTYTVPANRKCIVESAIAYLIRYTNSTLTDIAWISISDGGTYISLAEVVNATFGTTGQGQVGGTIVYTAGTVITGQTQDASGNGTFNYFACLKGTEFDA